MVVREDQVSCPTPEGALEQSPVLYRQGTARAAGDQFVAQKRAGPVGIRQKEHLAVELSQVAGDPLDGPVIQWKKQVPGTYHSVQDGSLP